MYQVLIVKLFIAAVLSIAIGLAYRYRLFIEQKVKGSETKWFWVSVILLRIIPFCFIYVFSGQDARSDVPMFYDSASHALQLQFVYRDFESAYQPLFAYITAIPLFFWHSADAILLQMILVEVLILWYNYRFISTQKDAFFKAFIYLLMPVSFVLTILSGQEDIWMWGFGLWSMWLMRKQANTFMLGISLGFSLIVTKVVIVLLLPAIFIYVKDKIRLILGLLVVGIPTLIVLYWQSELAFLSIINQANDPRTPNIWSLLNPWIDIYHNLSIKVLNWTGLASIIFISIFVAWQSKKNTSFEQFFPKLWGATFVWFMIIQQSSLANYAFIFLMPLWLHIFDINNLKQVVLLLIFNIMVVVQPPIWWGLDMPIYHFTDFISPINLIEYILEWSIVLYLGYLLINIIATNDGNKTNID
jgi:hypothetical protein